MHNNFARSSRGDSSEERAGVEAGMKDFASVLVGDCVETSGYVLKF